MVTRGAFGNPRIFRVRFRPARKSPRGAGDVRLARESPSDPARRSAMSRTNRATLRKPAIRLETLEGRQLMSGDVSLAIVGVNHDPSSTAAELQKYKEFASDSDKLGKPGSLRRRPRPERPARRGLPEPRLVPSPGVQARPEQRRRLVQRGCRYEAGAEDRRGDRPGHRRDQGRRGSALGRTGRCRSKRSSCTSPRSSRRSSRTGAR